jgi:hypothetical protein
MTRHTAFWPEMLDLSLAYLLCAAASTPFLLLMKLTLGTPFFVPAALLMVAVVVALIFLLDSLEKRVRVFSRPAAVGAGSLRARSLGAESPRSEPLQKSL